MHALHDYVAKQVADKLKSKKIVVWYDPRSEFLPFIAEVRGGARTGSEPVSVSVGGVAGTRLVEYAGSMFEVRAIVEPHVSSDKPESIVIYVPGCERDPKGSVLMELEQAGMTWEPQLKQLAKNVLLQKYTLGVVDEMLPFDRRVTYEDLENSSTRQARRIMNEVLGDLASAIHRLAKAGVEHAVVSADHGHLFFASDRDESMRTDAPGGDTVELHRRCWIGRGGATPPGCVRVAASALGYASDLEFVFPTGCGVFKAGGDLAFHHGGPSLQELIIPVLTVRTKVQESARLAAGPVTASGLPDAVSNRIFSVTLVFGAKQMMLGATGMLVRPLLMAAGKQVGAVGMAVDTELDRATGCVKLEPGKPVTLAFLLSDDTAASLRIVVQDPSTDAELYRSPTDIPVRLGV